MSDNCQCCVIPFITYSILFYFLFKCFIKFLERGWWILNRKSHQLHHNNYNESSINLTNGIQLAINDKSEKYNILVKGANDVCMSKRSGCQMNFKRDMTSNFLKAEKLYFSRNNLIDANKDEIGITECKQCSCLECSCKLTIYREKKGIMQSVTGKNLKVTYSDQLVYIP